MKNLPTILLFSVCFLSSPISSKKLKQPSTKVSWICSPLQLSSQEVSTECQNASGEWVPVQKDLNECLGVDNGNLVKREHGDFFSSCEECSISMELWCTCYDAEENVVESHLIMDDVIEFKDDSLHCKH
jgi:hypothetical protein